VKSFNQIFMFNRVEDFIQYCLEPIFLIFLALYNSLPQVLVGILEHVLLLWVFKALNIRNKKTGT